MKKSQFLLVFLVVVQTSFVAAQKVSNISYRQEQSSIIVSYDLETKTPCNVNLFVSTNGGGIWQGPLTKVTGDVGAKIASGSHSITWNVLEEFEELRGDKIQFQVRADVENIETVVIGTDVFPDSNESNNSWTSLTGIVEKDVVLDSYLGTFANKYNPIKIVFSKKMGIINVEITDYPKFKVELIANDIFESKEAGLKFEFYETKNGFNMVLIDGKKIPFTREK